VIDQGSLGAGEPPPHFTVNEISAHPVSRAYRIGLIGVVAGLCALPIIYFAIVGAIVFGIWFHATHDLWALGEHGIWGLVLYVGPLIIGPALIWFMLRPFFGKRAAAIIPQEITAETEPRLFDFIYRVCDLVRAPRPRHVYVDMQANASAAVMGFVGSLRRQLNLTIGLPLVSRLTIAEFGGVLAHEFGHFAQGAGMRLTFIIRTFNDWIARIAFQPEVLEQNLAAKMSRGGLYGLVVGLGLRAAIWITRHLLHRLLQLSHAISCYSTRQMEYDADLYEVKIGGPIAFAQVMKSLRWLNEGYSHAMTLFQHAANQGRVAANLVEVINTRSYSAQDYEVWTPDQNVKEEERWFSTHPSSANRIANVETFREQPALSDDRPATSLFSDFNELSRRATQEFYVRLGLPMEKLQLQTLEEFCRGEALTPKQIHQVNRFFSNRTSPDRPFRIGQELLADCTFGCDLSSLLTEWNTALKQTEVAFLQFVQGRAKRFTMLRAQALSQAGIRFRFAQFGLPNRSRAVIETDFDDATMAMADAAKTLRVFDEVTYRRLACALQPLRQSPEWPAIQASIEMLIQLADLWPLYVQIYEKAVQLSEVIQLGSNKRPRDRATVLIGSLASELETAVKDLEKSLQIKDPITDLTVFDRIGSRIYKMDGWPRQHQVVVVARELLTTLSSTYFQHLAVICCAAGSVEDRASKSEPVA